MRVRATDPAASPARRPAGRGAILIAIAGLGALSVVAGALLLVLGGTRVAADPNTFVTPSGPEGLIDENNSPSITRDPRHPERMAVVNRVDRPRYVAALHWSADGGVSWHPTPLPLPPDRDRPYGPDAAFAPDGTLYITYVNLEGTGNDPQTLWLSRSTDGGRTLDPPVAITGRYAFQARLAVDARGAVLVTWLQGMQTGTLSIVGPPSPILLARSDDGGRTWSAPARVSDASRPRVGAASPVVDGDGGIDVLYEDFKGDVRDFGNLDGPAWDQPFALVLARSVDGGRSFSPGTEVDAGLVPGERFLVYLPVFPSIEPGPGGSLYVAWADARNGDDDVFLRRSGDRGRTWSAPVRVNDNRSGDGTKQWMPRVAVAPGGRVDVLFLDRRADVHDVLTDAYLATSDDEGRSFLNARVSSQSFDSRSGSFAPGYRGALAVDLGSRLGLVDDDSGAVAVWTDTRLGSVDSGRQDIVSARITISRQPLPVPLSLIAAGLVLLGLAGRRRRVAQRRL